MEAGNSDKRAPGFYRAQGLHTPFKAGLSVCSVEVRHSREGSSTSRSYQVEVWCLQLWSGSQPRSTVPTDEASCWQTCCGNGAILAA